MYGGVTLKSASLKIAPMKPLSNLARVSFIVLSTCGAMAHAEPITEASGVCRVGESLIIAGDENPDSFWVIEDGSQKAKQIEVADGDWDDMEDLSAVDDRRFFAMTSHSRTKKGKRKPEREQLLLISKDGAELEVSKRWSLRKPILSAIEESLGQSVDIDTAEAASPDEGGLNIEGVAYHDGQLFLGLRSPLTQGGEAIVLNITNGGGLLKGEAPKFGRALTLPLGKKGVRGLSSHKTALLILAGPSDDVGQSFALYNWSPSTKTANLFALAGFDELLRPEGVAAEKQGTFTFVQDFEDPTQQEPVVKLPR